MDLLSVTAIEHILSTVPVAPVTNFCSSGCGIAAIAYGGLWWQEIITTYVATAVYTVNNDTGSTLGSSIIYPTTTTSLIDTTSFIDAWQVIGGVSFYTFNTMSGADSS